MQPAAASARKKKVTGTSAYTEEWFAKRDEAAPRGLVWKAAKVGEVVLANFAGNGRARADDTHIAA